MTEQQIMKEMLYKGIHSITVQSYKGVKPVSSRLDHPRTRLPLDEVSAHIEWLKQRVDEVIKYGRNK